MKTRIEEVEELISSNCSDMKIYEAMVEEWTKGGHFSEFVSLIRGRIELEIEKHDLLKK